MMHLFSNLKFYILALALGRDETCIIPLVTVAEITKLYKQRQGFNFLKVVRTAEICKIIGILSSLNEDVAGTNDSRAG